MKKILGIMMVALLLTGCGGEETTTVCKGNIDELTEIAVTLEAKGDKAQKMSGTYTYNFAQYVEAGATIDECLELIKSMNFDFNSVDGLKGNYKADGNNVILDIEIDYEKADIDDLIKAGLVESTGDKKPTFISLKETVTNLEKATQKGDKITCKEK